ncbi:MAG: sortase [Anaerolineales bacterium]
MIKKQSKKISYLLLVLVVVFAAVGIAQAAGYVDPTDKWAWGTNIGWVNFSPTHGGVAVYDDHLEGYAWGENIGWIRLGSYDGGGAYTYANTAANNYGVNNDGSGNLSGYAWGTNVGWINFNPTHSQVTIDMATGSFDGYAWGENVGWIHFRNTGANAYNVAIVSNLVVVAGGVTAKGTVVVDDVTVTGSVTEIEVEFNKDVNNPGSSDPDGVTNPANYLLIQTGTDEVYDTTACNSVSGSDVVIPTGPVTYDNNGGAGPYIATVTVNNGSKLPVGEYRLFVCGSTSIVDQNLVDLAGDGVTSGTDLLRTFNVAAEGLPATGFPPGILSILPDQPADRTYTDSGIILEVPSLGLEIPIVGVPLTEDGWEVAWLGQNAGYLEGTAFPTTAGNTGITAHVWDADNNPGPFAKLKNLRHGSVIKLHAWGYVYTYAVRYNYLTTPGNSTPLRHEDYDWITLLTCERYSPTYETYRFRRVVRAVLIDVSPE